ncbi:MAG: hypothetical protein A3I14_06625 [Candidatus Rokubacteria bacterium RIFCSPLOWO2_02_FULL_73_56]|nr:MAG: hypothetical protein A3I14_06625 [Candidatus Rokubacteria bacterium RIFCSPLOWO2_02_FULL_73_56]OGL30139.1 MAG: hypothetical protein A3G44_00635 [Candidatus Rokubacteria bacterium RIFCSPLOWO2_12_FULL_73_47]
MTRVIGARADPLVRCVHDLETRDHMMEGARMADKRDDESRPPLMQVVFDNIFLLLLIGIVVPVVFYTIWGLLEIASIPVAR